MKNIEPETHYFLNQMNLVSTNYTEETVNKSSDFQNNFSIYHVNIKSNPENLKQLIYYIQGIKYTFFLQIRKPGRKTIITQYFMNVSTGRTALEAV